MSAPSLCSALAIADSSTRLMIFAPFFGLKASTSSALPTGKPRIWSATSRPFWAERRTPRRIALVCICRLLGPYLRGGGVVGAATFLSAECALKVRVNANSPSLCPTMFSEMYTGMCCLPLCTAIVSPTKSGVIVERRDQVLIGRLSEVARAASTFACRWWSTNGPFLIERAIVLPLLHRVPAADDHAVGALVLARLVTLARSAPWRHRMMPAAATVGAPAHRVIDRIHGDSPHGRSDAAPTDRTRLADGAQVVLLVAYRADGRPAIDVHLADLARVHAELRVGTLARQELYGGAGRARDLPALAGQHLDAVDGRADRDAPQRHAVAALDRRVGAVHELAAHRNATRRDDVTALTVGVEQKRQMRAAVRIVFETLDLRRDAVLVPAEVHDAVMALVSPALVPDGDTSAVVAPRAAL